MKKTFLTFVLADVLAALSAQSIDFNFANRSDAEVSEPDYVPWAVEQKASESKTLDNGLTVTVSAAGNATVLRSQWHKNTCTAGKNGQTGLRLMGDGVVVFIGESDGNTPISTNTSTAIEVVISGLSDGPHSVAAYHVWKDPQTGTMPNIQVALGDQVVQTDVKFANVKSTVTDLKMADAPFSYVEFEVSEGKDVRLVYSTIVEAGKEYQTTNMMLNGLLIDRSPVIAMDPIPNHKDFHLDADGGSFTLQWAPATVAVKHKLVIGTDYDVVDASTDYVYTGTETQYTVQGLQSWNKYYWRVDEEDKDGRVYKGNVWSFQPRQLAFPEAEGYGRFARGGRGGVVYHVTNLNNNHEPGSLVYGLVDMQGPRTIVFDVSGVIDLGFTAYFVQPYATIAAQTAPGKGICIKASNINIGSDVICRHMRFKRGLGVYGENTGNAMGMSGADHSIVDHCTAAWGTDETVSGRGAQNISFQYSMIAEALGITGHKNYSDGTNHGYAATIDGRIGSWHHNLLANCEGRNWSMGGGMDANNIPVGGLDIFNNVVYNWHNRTTDGNCHAVNFVGNYYKMGPDTRRTTLFTQDFEDAINPAGKDQAYIHGNIRENKDHSLTQDAKGNTYNATGNIPTTYPYVVTEPLFPSYATIHTAKDAFKIVNSYSGAYMPCQDDHHKRIVRETVNGTYTYVGSKSGIKGEIDNEADCGGFEDYPEEHRPADFDPDQDGIPTWFESIVGTNPSVANHNADPDRDGWTLLEDYLEFMSHPYSVLTAGSQAEVDVAQYFAGFTKSPSYSVSVPDGASVTASVNGSKLTVRGGSTSEVVTLQLTVTDSEGSTFTRRYNVAVSGESTGIEQLTQTTDAQGVSHDLSGRRTDTQRGLVIRQGRVIYNR